MLKRLIVFCACLKIILGLNCYATDFRSNKIEVNNVKHELKNCNEHINDIRKLDGRSIGNVVASMRCYTTLIKTASSELVIKGCFPQNGCKVLEKQFEGIMKDSNVSCVECDGDGCNSSAYKILAPFWMYLIVTINSVLFF